MKKLFFFQFLSFFLLLTAIIFSQNWKQLNGEHFIVYFVDEEKFAKEIIDKAEVYYRTIAIELGYPRYSEFWTWDKRVKIYIYPDRGNYLKATKQLTWSEGMADYQKKEILSYFGSRNFVDSILPHEIAHLVFRDFVGFKGQIPLWLDEGVAQWAEFSKRRQLKSMVKGLYHNDTLITLKDLMKLDIRNIKIEERIYIRPTRTKEGGGGVLFLSGEQLVNNFYIQSASLIGFLIEKYGSYSFADFCRQLRDGKSVEEALKSAYPNHIKTLEDLENKWREYIEKD